MDLSINQGKDFSWIVRWEKEPFIYKAITAITKAAPARITAVGHGLKDGWRVAVVSVLGMTQINGGTPPRDRDYQRATVVDVDTIELNEVNAAGYSPYLSGGYLQFYTPASLAGATGTMLIKDKIGGATLATPTVVCDDTGKTITVSMTNVATSAITWQHGVYSLDISVGGVVTGLFSGSVTVTRE